MAARRPHGGLVGTDPRPQPDRGRTDTQHLCDLARREQVVVGAEVSGWHTKANRDRGLFGHRLIRSSSSSPQISAALEAFFTFCATAGGSVPEIVTLAETISVWAPEICRGVATGHSNAAAEGVNRLVKLVYTPRRRGNGRG